MAVQALAAWLLRADVYVEALKPFLMSGFWSVLALGALTLVLKFQWWATEDRPIRYKVALPRLQEPAQFSSNSREIRTEGSDAIRCYAPATGRLLGVVNPSSAEAIDRAVGAAKTAQKTWSTTTFRQRKRVLRSLLQHVLDHQEDICRVACWDSGKLPVDAALGEVLVVAERLRWTLAHGEASLKPSYRPTHPVLMPYKKNRVQYEPLGVVAALVSWNYPFHNLVAPMVSALFAGDGVVVKASEQTAWSAHYFTSLVRGALVAHGHDPAVVQSVVCWPHVARHLTTHPDIAHVTFIGSQTVAKHVAADAASALTPLCAELGGKDPFVVLDSVGSKRLPTVVETILRGTFQSSGQNCIGIERVLCGPKLYEQLVDLVTERVRNLRVGGVDEGESDSSEKPESASSSDNQNYDVGAMISDANFAHLEDLVQDAVAQGARLLAGGSRYHHPRFPHGHYFTPTLLVDVTPAMRIAQEECFGPILTVFRLASSDPVDVLAVANSAPFGLGASVFGDDVSRTGRNALNAIVDGIHAGMVSVNDFATYYAVQLPFGGVGGSGYGRFAGAEGLQALCNAKSICADRWAWLGVRTAIPPPVRYPVASQTRAFAFVRGVVELGYGLTLGQKIGGLLGLAKNG